MQPNLGWIYYRDYLNNYSRDEVRERGTVVARDIDWSYLSGNVGEPVKQKNKELLAIKNRHLLEQRFSNYRESTGVFDLSQNAGVDTGAVDRFVLRTTYPGLLVGSGYQHEAAIEGEFKLGFSFDHTTGMPVIPGSSVKGVLRNAFSLADLIREILQGELAETYRLSTDKLDALSIDQLEAELFGNGGGTINRKPGTGMLPLYERDIFYDSFIVHSAHQQGEARHPLSGCFLGGDFITPHKNREGKPELDVFSNPVPLQFLKVLPDVSICFQFELKDSRTFPFITRAVKLELFRQIILWYGLGAKTNVGYGQFTSEL